MASSLSYTEECYKASLKIAIPEVPTAETEISVNDFFVEPNMLWADDPAEICIVRILICAGNSSRKIFTGQLVRLLIVWRKQPVANQILWKTFNVQAESETDVTVNNNIYSCTGKYVSEVNVAWWDMDFSMSVESKFSTMSEVSTSCTWFRRFIIRKTSAGSAGRRNFVGKKICRYRLP